MTGNEDTLKALRAALEVSPDNLPLRQHFAEILLGLGRFEEAETEYRSALSLLPDNQQLKLGLARAFSQQGKNAQAIVVVEDLLRMSASPPFTLCSFAAKHQCHCHSSFNQIYCRT